LILSRLTGGSVLVGSGAIKNNLLILGQGRNFGKEFGGQEGSGKLNGLAVVIAGIGADQKALPGFYPGMAFGRGDARNHGILLLNFLKR
jgi:hypothetical protein